MCGINGIAGENVYPTEKIKIINSLSKMVHRGRDARGIFISKKCIFGHNRLAIIDLDKRSNQPMKFKNYVIAFNGEIYNYKKIREKLKDLGYKFKTESDTEVILKAYDQWGIDCVNKFVGQWAFAILEKKTGYVFMSRDRVGEKPLYYTIRDKKLYFASELPALLELIGTFHYHDSEALKLFGTGYIKHIPYDKTVYEGVHKLPAGHSMIFRDGASHLYRYWNPSWRGKRSNPNDYELIINKAIKRTAVSDVPIGILLSGGVDSTTIAYVLRNENPITYSVGNDKNDPELIRARKVAERLGLKNTEIIITDEEVRSRTKIIKEKLSHILGEPLNIKQHILTYLITQKAKKEGIKVLLTGNGADELFFGYDTANLTAMFGRLPNWKYKKYGRIGKELDIVCNSKLFIDKAQWLGLTLENEHSLTIAPDLGGMANTIELRTPFFDVELMEWAFKLPLKYKVKDGVNKWIMKRFLIWKLGKEFIFNKMGFGYNVGDI